MSNGTIVYTDPDGNIVREIDIGIPSEHEGMFGTHEWKILANVIADVRRLGQIDEEFDTIPFEKRIELVLRIAKK